MEVKIYFQHVGSYRPHCPVIRASVVPYATSYCTKPRLDTSITLLRSGQVEGDKRDQERSISRSSAFKDRTKPASALRIASAKSRFVCCSSATFSSTVSRANRR